ncbi:MAG: hypothetical protein A3K19_26645 [Lentisphaerae bacterium RIFOXYB12_FULL_65_16]|nr:MAG: hypothetical protein A3K18_18320 [Lentisphaerae bacterium RIFOXYA12_64_32]OGV86353.1 MAG: hypothetical protein A3K19_26645 [Lentisphaerae bacterium RIFOXYB12_FULL_65_16]
MAGAAGAMPGRVAAHVRVVHAETGEDRQAMLAQDREGQAEIIRVPFADQPEVATHAVRRESVADFVPGAEALAHVAIVIADAAAERDTVGDQIHLRAGVASQVGAQVRRGLVVAHRQEVAAVVVEHQSRPASIPSRRLHATPLCQCGCAKLRTR